MERGSQDASRRGDCLGHRGLPQNVASRSSPPESVGVTAFGNGASLRRLHVRLRCGGLEWGSPDSV